MQNKKQLLKPKIDIVFHALFRKGNEDITKAIITAVTKEKIEKINLDNDRHMIGKYPKGKMGILDLKATLDNGTICDIEIQLADNKDTAERFLYYWSRIYGGQLVRGEEYKKLNKVIGIIILDYEFDKTREIEEISTKWRVKEVQAGNDIELTDVLELYIIEIPKAKRILEKEPENKLAQWMMFMDNPNKEEVSRIEEENDDIKKAMDELRQMCNDEELQRLAWYEEKWEHDEASRKAREREEEEKRQKFQEEKEILENQIKKMQEEKGRMQEEKGRIQEEKGRIQEEKGRIQEEKGRIQEEKIRIQQESRKEEKTIIARNLKNKKIDIETIIQVTGLTKEEIQKL